MVVMGVLLSIRSDPPLCVCPGCARARWAGLGVCVCLLWNWPKLLPAEYNRQSMERESPFRKGGQKSKFFKKVEREREREKEK